MTELPGYTIQKSKRNCPAKHGEKVNFQWEQNGPGKGWISQNVPNSEVEARRREWQSFIGSGMIPYSKVKRLFSGRGLVVVAGNQDTLKAVEVTLRSLVRLESSIPVELHYWDDEISDDGFYCGYSFAQYNPDDDRVAFIHDGLVKTVDPEVMKWNREKGGYFRDYKRALSDKDSAMSVNVGIKFDGTLYKSDHGLDFQAAMCVDMSDVEPRNF